MEYLIEPLEVGKVILKDDCDTRCIAACNCFGVRYVLFDDELS